MKKIHNKNLRFFVTSRKNLYFSETLRYNLRAPCRGKARRAKTGQWFKITAAHATIAAVSLYFLD